MKDVDCIDWIARKTADAARRCGDDPVRIRQLLQLEMERLSPRDRSRIDETLRLSATASRNLYPV